MQKDDTTGYLDMAAAAVVVVAGLVFGCAWAAYKLARLLLRFAWWLSGMAWVFRALKRQFREYWVWRSTGWKFERRMREIERDLEYISQGADWSNPRPRFIPLSKRLWLWFQDRSFPAWVQSRTQAGREKPVPARRSREQ